jgi:hypothetical protein
MTLTISFENISGLSLTEWSILAPIDVNANILLYTRTLLHDVLDMKPLFRFNKLFKNGGVGLDLGNFIIPCI